MKEVEKKQSGKSSAEPASRGEVDEVLKKIFDTVAQAIKANESRKLSLDDVDRTLYALFDAVNRVHSEGKNVRLPDFNKILASSDV